MGVCAAWRRQVMHACVRVCLCVELFFFSLYLFCLSVCFVFLFLLLLFFRLLLFFFFQFFSGVPLLGGFYPSFSLSHPCCVHQSPSFSQSVCRG